jgi:hypothetical protein
MTLKLVGIEFPGEIEKERIVYRALYDVDIGDYAVFRCRTSKNDLDMILGGNFSGYWLPDVEVKAGDLVVLYTKRGLRSEKRVENTTSRFFYWNRINAVWVPGYTAALVKTVSYSLSAPIMPGVSEESDIDSPE